jgi:hypothetical protein
LPKAAVLCVSTPLNFFQVLSLGWLSWGGATDSCLEYFVQLEVPAECPSLYYHGGCFWISFSSSKEECWLIICPCVQVFCSESINSSLVSLYCTVDVISLIMTKKSVVSGMMSTCFWCHSDSPGFHHLCLLFLRKFNLFSAQSDLAEAHLTSKRSVKRAWHKL